jgi:hypothetical protein
MLPPTSRIPVIAANIQNPGANIANTGLIPANIGPILGDNGAIAVNIGFIMGNIGWKSAISRVTPDLKPEPIFSIMAPIKHLLAPA